MKEFVKIAGIKTWYNADIPDQKVSEGISKLLNLIREEGRKLGFDIVREEEDSYSIVFSLDVEERK